MCRIFSNKKGQVGETVTWIVATIIIISILGITFFVAAGFSFGGDKSVGQTTQVDILASKSFFSYLLTDDVYNQIKTEEDFNEANGNLAKEIFEGFYGGEYTKDVWVGILFNQDLSGEENVYFGEKPSISGGGGKVGQIFVHVSERIKLGEEKSFGFILLKQGVESYF